MAKTILVHIQFMLWFRGCTFGAHVGQDHYGYLPNTVVGGQELHGNLPVAVDVVKLGQEPHDSLADPVGVEPHGELPDEVDGAQVGQKQYVYLLNEGNNPDIHFFLHCFIS